MEVIAFLFIALQHHDQTACTPGLESWEDVTDTSAVLFFQGLWHQLSSLEQRKPLEAAVLLAAEGLPSTQVHSKGSD